MSVRKKAGQVTIKEVAELAGVSLMTVSRALHKPAVVAEKTRRQVEEAVRQLNYIPDLSAGSLSSKKSKMVAVIMPSLYFEGHARTVDGLSSELRKQGYHVLLGDNFYSQDEEMALLRVILGRRPAGVVMINSAHSDTGRSLLKHAAVPVIETWDLPENPMDLVVGFSHSKVGFCLAEHLIQSGYSKVAFIGGPTDSDPRANERRSGYANALKAYGLDSHRQIAIQENSREISAGKIGIQLLLEQFPDTDAVMCLTDRVAMGAMMECKRRSIRIPDELAIAGHGGFDFSDHLVPSLTTTRIDAFAIGVQAAQLLLNRIEQQPIPADKTRIDIGFDIVARESTVPSNT